MTGKYFWLKLKRDFFKRHDIRIIDGLPDGNGIILFYLKLLAESIDHEGKLRYSDKKPYTNEMLALVTETDKEIVTKAMQTLVEFELVEVLEDGTIYLPELKNMLGFETAWAKKKREYRTKHGQVEDKKKTKEGQKKDIVLNVSSMCPQNVRQEIEKEKELEIEKDIDIKRNVKEKTPRFIPPTVDEVRAYCLERNNGIDAEKFIAYYTSNGWKVGKNPMKNWKAAVVTWEKKNREITNTSYYAGNPFDGIK